ncbi:MAG: hypothetical protein LUQ64_05560 [Methanomicrobiales archaeon]|nr:hypothetical protein [Methanomicrobiales archaeon]
MSPTVNLTTAAPVGTAVVTVPTTPPQPASSDDLVSHPYASTEGFVSFNTTPLKFFTGAQWESFYTWARYHYEYRGLGYEVHVPYNTAAYNDAKYTLPFRQRLREQDYYVNAGKLEGYHFFTLVPRSVKIRYYDAIINDPAQELSYQYILNATRKIRDAHRLDDDEYAELISSFVQEAFPYRSDPDIWVTKYPIELIAEGQGDCDDKSLLLAGLLQREGYGVALIEFPDAAHLMVGILGDGRSNEYHGYLGIETTAASYIGFDHSKNAWYICYVYSGGQSSTCDFYSGTLYSNYEVLPMNDGEKFTHGNEIKLIWDKISLFRGYEDSITYFNDLQFTYTNADNRHMVFEYLTRTGRFKES